MTCTHVAHAFGLQSVQRHESKGTTFTLLTKRGRRRDDKLCHVRGEGGLDGVGSKQRVQTLDAVMSREKISKVVYAIRIAILTR